MKQKLENTIINLSVIDCYMRTKTPSVDVAVSLFLSNQDNNAFISAFRTVGINNKSDLIGAYVDPLIKLLLVVSARRQDYLRKEMTQWILEKHKIFNDSGINGKNLSSLVKKTPVDPKLGMPNAWVRGLSASAFNRVENIQGLFLSWFANKNLFDGDTPENELLGLNLHLEVGADDD